MKKLLLLIGLLLIAGCSTQQGEQNLGASVVQIYGGGTGTTTIAKGYLLMGKGNNQYTRIASSSFGGGEPLWRAASSSYLTLTGNFRGTWSGVASTSFALSSSLSSYLLRSASTSIPGLISTASSSAWNALQYSKKGWADFSNTATGLTYTNTTGATAWTAGYSGMLTASSSQWNKFFKASTTFALSSSVPTSATTTAWENVRKYPQHHFTISSSTATTQWPSSTGSSSVICLGHNLSWTSEVWNTLGCYLQGGASPTGRVQFSDGTNLMNKMSVAGTYATTSLTTNNTFIHNKAFCITMMSFANNPQYLSCDVYYRQY